MPNPDPTDLNWIQLLFIVGLPAAFGGLLQGFHESHKQVVTNTDLIPINWIAISISALFGIGGGAAVILAVLWSEQLKLGSADKNILIWITLGVVAGFVGNRLLPMVAASLERRMTATEKGSKDAIKEAQMAAASAGGSAKEAAKALLLSRALYAERKSQFRKLVTEFSELVQNEPLNRVYSLALANVYKRAGEFENAEGEVTKYISRKGNDEDGDLAESLYVRACYRILQSDDPAGEHKKQSGLEDLEHAIRIDSSYKLDAAEDEDLKILRTENDLNYARIVA